MTLTEPHSIPARFAHQQRTLEHCLDHDRVCDWSDPGTGKTRGHLDFCHEKAGQGKALVLAPLSLLDCAWANDARKFSPWQRVSLAYAANREKAFQATADIVVANHDAVKWIRDQVRANPKFLADFDTLIIDEVNAFKNPKAARTKALIDIRHHFQYRHILTGTPAPQSLLDLWAPVFVCDDGERLGTSFYAFRNQVTVPVQVGPRAEMVQWRDRPGAEEMVTAKLADISIRHCKADCLDIPPNQKILVPTKLPASVMRLYQQMLNESVFEFESGGYVNAIHAGAKANKLLQICTGAVYDGDKTAHLVHVERYQQVIDLMDERPWPCVVFFNWRHEREALSRLAEAAGMSHAVIDGETPAAARPGIVDQFQAGKLKVIFAHPASAGHGLTLTAGKTTIWASPTANAEHFLQANARIDRNGQDQRTETIMLAAEGTREEALYESMLEGKVRRVDAVLNLFTQLQEAA